MLLAVWVPAEGGVPVGEAAGVPGSSDPAVAAGKDSGAEGRTCEEQPVSRCPLAGTQAAAGVVDVQAVAAAVGAASVPAAAAVWPPVQQALCQCPWCPFLCWTEPLMLHPIEPLPSHHMPTNSQSPAAPAADLEANSVVDPAAADFGAFGAVAAAAYHPAQGRQ